MNSLFTINPYKWNGQWVFDDKAHGLDKEALVAGIDKMMDIWAARLRATDKGLTVVFSDKFFPSSNFLLRWEREEVIGNWYWSNDLKMQGWLCPALLLYFSPAPKEIFMKISAA